VGEYRTERYIIEQGPDDYLNAAHNVALQYGATTGYIGIVLWLALFLSAGVLVLVAAWRWTGPPWLIASVGGLLAVYVAQALISIDDLRLKEMGWLAAGLAVAAAVAGPRTGEFGSASTTRAWVTSGVLGLVGLVLCLPPITSVWRASDVQTVEAAVASATDQQLPWDRRLELLVSIGGVAALQQTWAVGQQINAIDVRGPGQAASLAEVATLAGDNEQALQLAVRAVEFDPLSPRSWLAYSLVLARTGDQDGAVQALDQANQLNRVRPLPGWESLVQSYEQNKTVQ
jgi:tetratricopeptide (TPR) repeat protein